MYRAIAHTLWISVLLIGGSVWGVRAFGEEQTRSDSPEACPSLVRADFSGMPEAPTQVTEAAAVKGSEALPRYCKVTGYVAPQVGFKLALPDKWNGKFIAIGCGGHCGYLSDEELAGSCGEAIGRGYACIVSDMGHRGSGGDGLWAHHNLQATMDWGYRGPHVVAVAGKAITETFYRKSPAYAYFAGCSTGGRQALQEAQRFPWDFDGIIAGAPPIRLADLYVTFAWGQRAGRDASGKPLLSLADLKLLTEGALARCDLDDGVRDGVISNPFACPFRAADVACRKGQTSGCLTPGQVQAAAKIYSGPVDGAGRSLFEAGAAPGSELGGAELAKYGGNWGVYYLGTEQEPAAYAGLTQDGLRDLFFSPAQAANWTIRQFDFDKDYQRLDVMQSLYDSSNPDLSRFRNAGGKLLIYHGLNDLSILPQWIIRYYEKVERVMGGREQTQSFARLFTLPGMDHCFGGPGADTVDYLTALERWVEQGEAPDRLTAFHRKTQERRAPVTFGVSPDDIAFSRPVYPYPVKVRYRGEGDANEASSFEATEPR